LIGQFLPNINLVHRYEIPSYQVINKFELTKLSIATLLSETCGRWAEVTCRFFDGGHMETFCLPHRSSDGFRGWSVLKLLVQFNCTLRAYAPILHLSAIVVYPALLTLRNEMRWERFFFTYDENSHLKTAPTANDQLENK